MLPTLDYSFVELFNTRREAVFTWSAVEQRFILRQSGGISSSYLDWLEGEWTDQGFLEHHTHELTEIAKNGTAEQKIWLQKFLDSTHGPQAVALKARLGAQK